MGARRLRRELGVALRCDGCSATRLTANIRIKANRRDALRVGWIRGGAKGHRKWDFCPGCAPAELALIAEEARAKLARAEARAAAAKARMDPTMPLARRPRRKPAQEVSAEA